MLLQLLIVAIIVGAVVYIVRPLPIDETFKRIVIAVAIVIFAIYALRALLPLAGLN